MWYFKKEECNLEFSDFTKVGKTLVVDYVKKELFKSENLVFEEDEVYVVWLSKTLQNSKMLLSTTLDDGMYYELTYNGGMEEIYFDAYKKVSNIKFEGDKINELSD